MAATRKIRTRRRRSRLWIVPIVLVLVLALAVAAGASGALALGKSWLVGLPDYTDPTAFDTSEPTRIYSADGALLARLYLENRETIPEEAMGPWIRKATVAIEDERFYQHKGWDPIGMGRAFMANLTTGDPTGEGASTITQQYVRNTILKDEVLSESTLQSYQRKVREVYLANELEKIQGKDDILSMYLNTIYYGGGAHGIEAASKTFFAKNARDLTLSQAALLSGLPQQPSRLSPFENLDGAIARRNIVLGRMLRLGMITPEEHQVAVDEEMVIETLHEPEGGIYAASYFVAHVKKLLQEQFPAATVFQGGLDVRTTVQMDKQAAAEAAVAAHLHRENDPDAALVSINPDTGHVVALYGGRDYTDTKFNLATQAKRQTGSTFKTFTLVTALEQGMPPTFKLSAKSPAKIPIPSGVWTVNNAGGGGGGITTLRSATEHSLNVPFAHIITDPAIGPERVVELAHRMGITSDLPTVPSVTLGSAGTTALEMASAHGPLANGGKLHDPVFITEVKDRNGAVIFVDETVSRQVIDPSIAWAATDILEGDLIRGTASRARIGRPAAGKTGTSQLNRDAYFVGYTPDLVTSVWVGHAQEKTVYIGGRLAWGGTIACPIWKSYMDVVVADMPVRDFPTAPPPAYTASKFKPAVLEIEDLVGLTWEQAQKHLEGVTVTITDVYSDAPLGTILSQRVEGMELFIEMSIGPDPATIAPPPPAPPLPPPPAPPPSPPPAPDPDPSTPTSPTP